MILSYIGLNKTCSMNKLNLKHQCWEQTSGKKLELNGEKQCSPIVWCGKYKTTTQIMHEIKSWSVKCSRKKLTTFNLADSVRYERKVKEKREVKWPYLTTFLFSDSIFTHTHTHKAINFWFMKFKIGIKNKATARTFFSKIQTRFWL